MRRLRATLDRIDRRGYGAYKELAGSFDFDGFTLHIDRVQRDPFAPPSLVRVRTRGNRFDPSLFENRVRRVAFEDFLTREVGRAIGEVVRGNRGSGGSGRVEIQRPSQKVLPRTSMVVGADFVEARMAVGLPARGRSVDGRAARAVLLEELPEVVGRALAPEAPDPDRATLHVETSIAPNTTPGVIPACVAHPMAVAAWCRAGTASTRPRHLRPSVGIRGHEVDCDDASIVYSPRSRGHLRAGGHVHLGS